MSLARRGMSVAVLLVCTAAALACTAAVLASAVDVPVAAQETLTLEGVLAMAKERAPALRAARAVVAAAEGGRRASRYRVPEEPVLELEAAPRSAGGGEDTIDLGVALSQRFEIGGQRGKRSAGADQRLAAAASDLAAAERDHLAAVARAYLRAAAATARLELATRALAWAGQADAAAAARHEEGDIALLDRNLAAIELVRIEAELWGAESAASGARLDLAALVGADPGLAPGLDGLEAAIGRLERGDSGAPAPSTGRAEVAAAAARVEERRAELALRQAERIPDLVGTVGRSREEGADRLTRFGLAFELPIFRRNRGEIETAAADLERALAEQRQVELEVGRDAGRAQAGLRAAEGAARALGPEARRRLEQNLELAGEGFQAGKIGLLELLMVRRSGLEAQRLLLDARLAYGEALVEARRAAGRAPLAE